MLHHLLINVFLLIIFMVTAPLLTVGVQVDLQVSRRLLPDDQEPLTISTSKGEIIFKSIK